MSSTKSDRTAPLDAAQETEPLGRVEKTLPLPPVERTHHMAPGDVDRAIAAEDGVARRSSRIAMWAALAACLSVGLLLGGAAVLLVQSASEAGAEVPLSAQAAEGAATAQRPQVAPATNPGARSDPPPPDERTEPPAVESEPAPGNVEGAHTNTAEPTAARNERRGATGGGIPRQRGGEVGLGASEVGLGGLRATQGGAGQQQQEGERVVERVVRGRINAEGVQSSSGGGVFDSDLVVRQLRVRQFAIQRCYERLLADNPRLSGRVIVRFSIQPSGVVTDATATENSTASPAVADCVLTVVRGLRFNPGPVGGAVTYSFPFEFQPQR